MLCRTMSSLSLFGDDQFSKVDDQISNFDDQLSKVDDQISKFDDQLSKVTANGGGADTAVSFGRRRPVSGVASFVPSGDLDY